MQNFHSLLNSPVEYLPLLLFVEWKTHFHPHFIVHLLGLSSCRTDQGSCFCKPAKQSCTSNCLCNKAKCKNKVNNNFSFVKWWVFWAYCNLRITGKWGGGGWSSNTPVDPDGEVQLFNEVQSSATQIEVKTITRSQIHCSLHRTLNLNFSKINQNTVYTWEVPE